MMKTCFPFLLSFCLIWSTPMNASTICGRHFVIKPTETLTAVKLQQNDDPTVSQLIRMLIDTVHVNGNREDTLASGELRLGHRLNEGDSVEFKYVLDRRSGDLVFHLQSISFSKRNGRSIKIDEQPVSDDGRVLTRSHVVIERQMTRNHADQEYESARPLTDQEVLERGQAESDFNHRLAAASAVPVPVELRGERLQSLLRWVDIVPHLNRNDVRTALERNRLTPIMWLGQVKANLAFMGQVAKKQFFKYILIGGIFVLLMQAQNFLSQPLSVNEVLEPHTKTTLEQSLESLQQNELEQGGKLDLYWSDRHMREWRRVEPMTYYRYLDQEGHLIGLTERGPKTLLLSTAPKDEQPDTMGHSAVTIDESENRPLIEAIQKMVNE